MCLCNDIPSMDISIAFCSVSILCFTLSVKVQVSVTYNISTIEQIVTYVLFLNEILNRCII